MRDPFQYRLGELHCEDVPLAEVAQREGTPCYVYSAAALVSRYRAYTEALAGLRHTICYAVKANSNLALLGLLAREGAGFDIVSGGELYRVLQAGGEARRVVFSGVGKTVEEIEYALRENVHSFNCESEEELAAVDAAAGRLGCRARVALRANPDVDAATHPYISTGLNEHKFGIDFARVEAIFAAAQHYRHLDLAGVSCHIGSQLLDAAPLLEAVDRMLALVARLRARGVAIRDLDLGGGLGVPYHAGQHAPVIGDVVAQLREKLAGVEAHLFLEPGRSIVGEAGVLLTRVLYRKRTPEKEFVIVDAAMNDLIRPSLYKSHHEIVPVRETEATVTADVVGPVCESSDFFARDRVTADVPAGGLLAICTAGAYGAVLSSNYNSRPRAPEVLVEGNDFRVVRARETYADLVRGEVAAGRAGH